MKRKKRGRPIQRYAPDLTPHRNLATAAPGSACTDLESFICRDVRAPFIGPPAVLPNHDALQAETARRIESCLSRQRPTDPPPPNSPEGAFP